MKHFKPNLLIFSSATFLAAILTLQACRIYHFRSDYQDANKLLYETDNLETKPFLKAHLKNGDVIILTDTWEVDTTLDILSGKGSKYDYNRKKVYEGDIGLPIDSVAIFETNNKITPNDFGRIAALTILTGLDVGIYCLINPKACFGSCPSFYLDETDNIHSSDAEGFSNAISPSLEYFDIDALNDHWVTNDNFSITMKNEALETHCVNELKLLAFPLTENERIYHSPENKFYLCENNYTITRAEGPEGDITGLLYNSDKQERWSSADENNLSSKEEIYLDFENLTDPFNLGLVISFRQTLMTTYFIYSAMGYGGNQVGEVFAMLETEGANEKLTLGIGKELGNIDCYFWDEDKKTWENKGGFYETGPIAINHQILPLNCNASDGRAKIKLVVNKGLWLIDHLALTNIREKTDPVEIAPAEILNKGKTDEAALSRIQSPGKYLITMPGDVYTILFGLPEENQHYELFLYSKGYYLEWMRESWIHDKDLLKLRQMIDHPEKYLKKEAKAYKQYETTMVREFWNSRIDTEIFLNHEK